MFKTTVLHETDIITLTWILPRICTTLLTRWKSHWLLLQQKRDILNVLKDEYRLLQEWYEMLNNAQFIAIRNHVQEEVFFVGFTIKKKGTGYDDRWVKECFQENKTWKGVRQSMSKCKQWYGYNTHTHTDTHKQSHGHPGDVEEHAIHQKRPPNQMRHLLLNVENIPKCLQKPLKGRV